MTVGGTGKNGLERQVEALDWARVGEDLDAFGFATTGALLDAEACHALATTYDDDAVFRSHVVMRRHGFGEGEYKYFCYPLPDPIERLRQAVYPKLAPIANRWMAAMGMAHRYPDTLDPFLARCHEAGQRRPTPLLLKYHAGDYNRLHQDLYGEQFFSDPARHFAERAGNRVRRRRLRSDRAAPAHAVPASRWCRLLGAKASCSRSASGQCREPAAPIGSRCAMASAGSDAGTATHTGIIFHDAA